jgi:subtilisin-like proprotein convertase family protein
VENLTVTLSGLTHSFVGDLDIALVSPSLKAIKLMSDLSDASPQVLDVTNLVLTFSAAGEPLPEFGELESGEYLPKDDVSNDGDDALPVPAGTVFTTNLTDFVGTEASGVWRLYVQDDQFLDGGRISGGWTLTIWWSDSGPQLTSARVLNGQGLQLTIMGQTGRTHTIVASTDLVHWQLVTNVFLTSSPMQIILPDEPNGPFRFFRAQRCSSTDLFHGIPARLTSPKYLGDGLFQAVLVSSAGRTHVIESSSDLQNWTRVSTNYMNAAEMLIVVPGPTSPNFRFYRAVEP